MIERTGGGFAVSCDFCSTEVDLQTHDFEFVVKAMKDRGWAIHKNTDGTWLHRCPSCVEDGKAKKAEATT